MSDNWLQPIRDAVRTRDLASLSNIFVAGIEVTQAIQHCNAAEHLTDPADRGPDNSIPIVADKPAFVRVYVRTLLAPVEGVTGTLTLQRRRNGVWTDAGAVTKEWPHDIVAAPGRPYAQERGELGNSLNFLIPAAEMRGRMRLRAEVEVPGTDYRATDQVEVIASLHQTLRLRGIPVRYMGPNSAGAPVDLAAPTLADFRKTAAMALSMFPVSHVPDIGLAGIFTWDRPLTGEITTSDGAAQCPTSWNNLLFWLAVAKAIDGNRPGCLYYALLPLDIPVGTGIGCGGGGGVAAGFSGGARSMAHELGHVLGFGHAPCGLVEGDFGDTGYPAYQPYDTANAKKASIGEYGYDMNTGRVQSPVSTRDIMSYCAPRWISPYHYRRLIEHPLLNPRWIPAPPDELPPFDYDWPPRLPGPDPRWQEPWDQERFGRPAPRIIVTGILEDDRIEVRSVLRLTAYPTTGATVLEGGYAEARYANQREAERVPLLHLPLHACGNCAPGCKCGGRSGGGSGLVQACLPDREDLLTVRLVRRDKEIFSRVAASSPTLLDGFAAAIEGGELRAKWQTASSSLYPTERALRGSRDGGESWELLALQLPDDTAAVPLDALPAGELLVQAIVSDGFSTVLSEAVRVRVPERAPAVTMLWPRPDFPAPAGGIVRLWGVGTAGDGRRLSGEELEWELDGATVATGTESWITLPEGAAEHRLILRGRDGEWVSEEVMTIVAGVGRNS